MSRMLAALKRIEAESTQRRLENEIVRAEVAQAAVVSQPVEAVYGDAVVQAALQQVEIACAAVAAASAPAENIAVDVRAQAPSPAVESPAAAGPRVAAEPPAAVDAQLVEHVLSQISAGVSAVLLFTSPEDGTGKSGVLWALAEVLAERIDGELLVVDGNLHDPELSGRRRIPASKGLADVLLGAADWQDVTCPTATPRLSVLPGVKRPADKGRLPKQSNLRALWQELRGRFRLVLVDAPSLAHEEAAWLARDCTGAYLLVRLKHTSRRALAESVEVLRQDHVRLLGCVVIES